MALRSSPTEKCGPLAAMTTARTVLVGAQRRPWRGAGRATGPGPWRCGPRAGPATPWPPRRRARCSAPATRNLRSLPCRQANRLVGPPGGGPVECMGRTSHPKEDSEAPAHLQRRGVRGPGRAGLAPRAAGRRLRGLRVDPAALRERGGLALHTDRRPRPRRLRARHGPTGRRRAGIGGRGPADGAAAPRSARRPGACWCTTGDPAVRDDAGAGPRRASPSAAADGVPAAPTMLGLGAAGRRRAGPAQRRLHPRRRVRRRAGRRDGGRPGARRPLVRRRGAASFPRTVRARRRGGARLRGRGLRRAPTARTARWWCRSPSCRRPTGASLSYVSLQILAGAAWSIARLAARGGGGRRRCARSPSGSAPSYGRIRADVVGRRPGRLAARSSPPISATGPRCTTSAPCRTTPPRGRPASCCARARWPGTSRSVYSGLIRVHRGAVRSDARQTNHNLVLDEGAHADSVPNLDILENDVQVLPRLDGGTDRRGPALLHRVAGRGARGGRGPHRARLLRRHHRPGPRSRACTALLEREVHDRLDAALGGRRVAAGA